MAKVKNDYATFNNSFRREYTNEASKFYLEKMKQLLGENDNESDVYTLYINGMKLDLPLALKGYVPNGNGGVRLELPIILMHRIDTLKSKDGHRLYEFLIEYDIDSPSVGIYYGCRGVTVDGFNHEQEIELFRNDFEKVSTEMCRVLNNTFLDKDFSYRLKLTDNANDGTYWLFWITLNEEEDIYDVGVNATTIIRNVFKRYLNGEEFSNVKLPKKRFKKESMSFTNEAFQSLLDNMKYYHFGGEIEDGEKSKKAQDLFKRFLEKAVHVKKIMIKDSSYESAYRVLHAIDKEECGNVDFARMMYAFFDYLCNKELLYKKENETYIELPWEALRRCFLDKDGNAFSASIKTQLNHIKKSNYFDTENEKLKAIIRDWLEF